MNSLIRDSSRGLRIANSSAHPDHSVEVAFAELVLQDLQHKSIWINETKLTIDITQHGVNGLDAGAEEPYTWYYIWAITNLAGVRAGLLSKSPVTPVLPPGFSFYAFLGAIQNCRNGGSDFGPIDQTGHVVARNSVIVLNGGTAVAATAVDCAAALPEMARTAIGTFTLNIGANGGRGEGWVRSRSDQGVVGFAGFLDAPGYLAAPFCLPVIETQRLYYNRLGSSSTESITIGISGFEF